METPEKINAKIAELKGIKIKNFEDCKTYKEAGESILAEMSLKNWAENISDAWELFEEMDYDKIITENRYAQTDKWICGCADGISEELSEGPWGSDMEASGYWRKENKHFVKAETAPLAICLAWLKWKVGDK